MFVGTYLEGISAVCISSFSLFFLYVKLKQCLTSPSIRVTYPLVTKWEALVLLRGTDVKHMAVVFRLHSIE